MEPVQHPSFLASSISEERGSSLILFCFVVASKKWIEVVVVLATDILMIFPFVVAVAVVVAAAAAADQLMAAVRVPLITDVLT